MYVYMYVRDSYIVCDNMTHVLRRRRRRRMILVIELKLPQLGGIF